MLPLTNDVAEIGSLGLLSTRRGKLQYVPSLFLKIARDLTGTLAIARRQRTNEIISESLAVHQALDPHESNFF